MIFIKDLNKITDTKYSIGYIHYCPMDQANGLGKTEEELNKEGILLNISVPIPDSSLISQGKVATLYYNPVDKILFNEYTDNPDAPKIPVTLDDYKNIQKQKINQACEKAITGGFTSNAHKASDGTYPEVLYGSEQEDQNNILGNAFAAESKLGGNPICKDDTFVYHAKEKDYEEWQPLECIQLAKDWKDFKTHQLLKNKQIQAYIDTLKTVEEIQKVTWDTVIN